MTEHVPTLTVSAAICICFFIVFSQISSCEINHKKVNADLEAKKIEVERIYAQQGLVQRYDAFGRLIWTTK